MAGMGSVGRVVGMVRIHNLKALPDLLSVVDVQIDDAGHAQTLDHRVLRTESVGSGLVGAKTVGGFEDRVEDDGAQPGGLEGCVADEGFAQPNEERGSGEQVEVFVERQGAEVSDAQWRESEVAVGRGIEWN